MYTQSGLHLIVSFIYSLIPYYFNVSNVNILMHYSFHHLGLKDDYTLIWSQVKNNCGQSRGGLHFLKQHWETDTVRLPTAVSPAGSRRDNEVTPRYSTTMYNCAYDRGLIIVWPKISARFDDHRAGILSGRDELVQQFRSCNKRATLILVFEWDLKGFHGTGV